MKIRGQADTLWITWTVHCRSSLNDNLILSWSFLCQFMCLPPLYEPHVSAQSCSCNTVRLCMQAAGKEQEFQDLLSQTESAKLEGGALDKACAALQELVSSVALKDKVLEQACGHLFLSQAQSIVRRVMCMCSLLSAHKQPSCTMGHLQ